MTRPDREVVEYTWTRVKNNFKLTNFEKYSCIDFKKVESTEN